MPRSRKRVRHIVTVGRLTRKRRATALLDSPSAIRRIICARRDSAAGTLCERAIDSSCARSAPFLALLIQEEVARREQKKFDLRLRRATFRATKTLEQFHFERLPRVNRALVNELATGRYIAEHVPVLIVGPCGTGKSHIAQALGHCAVRQGQDGLFTTCAQLTTSLNAARATGGYERKLATLARITLLIIDDFGLKPLRPPADEDLHDLIAERYETASTIVTSNLDFSEWDQAFPAVTSRHYGAGIFGVIEPVNGASRGHLWGAKPERV